MSRYEDYPKHIYSVNCPSEFVFKSSIKGDGIIKLQKSGIINEGVLCIYKYYIWKYTLINFKPSNKKLLTFKVNFWNFKWLLFNSIYSTFIMDLILYVVCIDWLNYLT